MKAFFSTVTFPIVWFFRRLADAAMIEEAGSGRQRDDPSSTGAPASLCRKSVYGPRAWACLFMDLFSHWGGERFFLRRSAFIVPLGTTCDLFLVGDPRCPEAAASVGATVAL